MDTMVLRSPRVLILLGVILADVAAISVLAVFVYFVSQPRDAHAQELKQVVVGRGLGVQQIADVLQEEEIIQYDTTFVAYAVLSGKGSALQAGVYELGPNMSQREIISILSAGQTIDHVRVIIYEGDTIDKIANRLYMHRVIEDQEAFELAATIKSTDAKAQYQYAFFDAVPEAYSLEGFLFPDTYEFKVGSSSEEVIDAMLHNFSERVGDRVGRTERFYDVLIMASILQREVRSEEEMRLAASVINNRVANGMPLQMDATLVYVLKRVMRSSDKSLDSPYNTYRYTGLPPTPIANPSLQAIDAALNPASSDYIFYVSDRSGVTHFARTLSEHNRNIARYLR
ncbi:MAG: endolytic transglycosylase MltG [Candidatus Spechtbacterales bacterium]